MGLLQTLSLEDLRAEEARAQAELDKARSKKKRLAAQRHLAYVRIEIGNRHGRG